MIQKCKTNRASVIVHNYGCRREGNDVTPWWCWQSMMLTLMMSSINIIAAEADQPLTNVPTHHQAQLAAFRLCLRDLQFQGLVVGVRLQSLYGYCLIDLPLEMLLRFEASSTICMVRHRFALLWMEMGLLIESCLRTLIYRPVCSILWTPLHVP